jgi:hypothetical protein
MLSLSGGLEPAQGSSCAGAGKGTIERRTAAATPVQIKAAKSIKATHGFLTA